MKIRLIAFFVLFASIMISCIHPGHKNISIKQLKSEYPIFLWRDTVRNTIYCVNFPFAFEFENKSLKKRRIGGVRYYYSSDKRNGRWNSNVKEYLEVDGKLIVWGGHSKENGTNFLRKDKYVIYTAHILDPSKKDDYDYYLKSYLEKMEKLHADTLGVGTMEEFIHLNKEFTHGILGNDSIGLKIYNNRIKIDTIIYLPIIY